jgi:small subunit ribosomal protein S4e
MARGPTKIKKRLNAPSHWMLDKLGGIYAPKPSAGPHKSRRSLPLMIILRNRLKYALNGQEVKAILMQRLIKIDGKTRTDNTYPVGFQDVIEIQGTEEYFRLMVDTKGRPHLHKITKEEATYKLCRVKKVMRGNKGIPFVVTHDGRSIRYPEPEIRAHDSLILDIKTQKIMDFIKFEIGNISIITNGNNAGRIGLITHQEKHPGSNTIVTIRDSTGKDFATPKENVFVIGKGIKPMLSLPNGG